MKKLTTLCGMAILLLCAHQHAGATTIAAQYNASAAVSDLTYYSHNHNHALYLPGFATDLVFQPGALFTQFVDGTGILTAQAFSLSAPANGFDVVLHFSGLVATSPTNNPKRELLDNAYSENGGPVDVETWFYYQTWQGTLSGTGDFAGSELTLVARGPAFQWGIGASGKNVEFGGSGWFTAMLTGGGEYTGDFNLNAQPVPLPAGLPLLVSAMVGMGLISRRG